MQALYWRRPEGAQTPQLFLLIAFTVAPPESETCGRSTGRVEWMGEAGEGQGWNRSTALCFLDFSITDETKVLYLACYFHWILPFPRGTGTHRAKCSTTVCIVLY